MKEKGRSSDPKLSQEHWKGHGSQDKCEWKLDSGHSVRPPVEVFKYTDGKIREFFKKEPPEPTTIFLEGQTFDASQYPSGTVIGITNESDILSPVIDDPHAVIDRFGVTYAGDKKFSSDPVIIVYPPEASLKEDGELPRHPKDPVLEVGEVNHTRILDKILPAEYLHRVNKVMVYEVGTDQPQPTDQKPHLDQS